MRFLRTPLMLIAFLGLFANSALFAQFQDPTQEPEENTILGGLGITWIDDQPYTTFTIAPDLHFGKVGVGLYLQFLMDNENNFELRKDEFEDGRGILRVIRYIRYGRKYDKYFFRVGMLDRATLGNGFLMWNYNNGSNYDKRKVGLVADVDLGTFGFESVTSSIGSGDISGYNLFIRPFRLINNDPDISFADRFRVYTTFVRDNKVATAVQDSSASLSAFGIGADLQWLNLPFLKSSIYGDYASINDYGSGTAMGVNLVFPEFIGLLAVSAKYEKRFLKDNFVPSLFGPLYELEQRLYSPSDSIGTLFRLESARESEGYFGELAGHVINRIRLIGNYQALNGIRGSGRLHLEASAPNLIPKFELRAYYDKSGIETLKDARTLDAQSVATGEISYQLNRYLLLTTIYRWYWVEDPDNPGVYKPIERIEPRLSFRYVF